MKSKDPIWNMYTLCEVDGKTVAKCRDCETSVSAKSDMTKESQDEVWCSQKEYSTSEIT